ncbi:MAG: hypothetical protein GQ551_07555 [Myxococcales bacterium]|nr:hypothetical protein [Myxococcales bacterium]
MHRTGARVRATPDDAVCVSDTGLSACLTGGCQLIWPSCTGEGAEEGDFCQPDENVERIGRCEIGLDRLDGNACTGGMTIDWPCRSVLSNMRPSAVHPV